MDNKNNTIRVNIRISQKLKDYFEMRSTETGVAQSALMALALEEYVSQKLTLNFVSNVDEYFAKLEELKSKTD